MTCPVDGHETDEATCPVCGNPLPPPPDVKLPSQEGA